MGSCGRSVDTEVNVRPRGEVSTAEKWDRVGVRAWTDVLPNRASHTLCAEACPCRGPVYSPRQKWPLPHYGEGGKYIRRMARKRWWGNSPSQYFPQPSITLRGPWRPACSGSPTRIRGERACKAVFDGIEIAHSLPWRWRLPDPPLLNILSTVYCGPGEVVAPTERTPRGP